MSETKEAILQTALHLFAKDGYEAVSVSAIAGALGMTKGALYKHYKSKRDIFDSIVRRMEQLDQECAQAYEMPAGAFSEMADAYGNTPLDRIKGYSEAQFRHWTEEEFSANFRKLLTLEQYRSPEMAQLYQQYLAGGPVSYMEDLFREMTQDATAARRLALDFYAPLFLLYAVYDGAEEKEPVLAALREHLARFSIERNYK
jgi:AcrR family transcriptional regulator